MIDVTPEYKDLIERCQRHLKDLRDYYGQPPPELRIKESEAVSLGADSLLPQPHMTVNTAKIVELVRKGVDYGEITRLTGSSYDCIKTIVSRERKRGVLPKTFKRQTFKINPRIAGQLASEALERKVTAEALCQQLIETICADDLFNAVLEK